MYTAVWELLLYNKSDFLIRCLILTPSLTALWDRWSLRLAHWSLNLVQANNLYSPFRFNFIFLGWSLNLSDSFPAGLTQLLLKWHLGIGLELPWSHSLRDPGPCAAVSRVLRAGLVSSSDVLLACVPDICDCWRVLFFLGLFRGQAPPSVI